MLKNMVHKLVSMIEDDKKKGQLLDQISEAEADYQRKGAPALDRDAVGEQPFQDSISWDARATDRLEDSDTFWESGSDTSEVTEYLDSESESESEKSTDEDGYSLAHWDDYDDIWRYLHVCNTMTSICMYVCSTYVCMYLCIF
jgi:hypothetical protein